MCYIILLQILKLFLNIFLFQIERLMGSWNTCDFAVAGRWTWESEPLLQEVFLDLENRMLNLYLSEADNMSKIQSNHNGVAATVQEVSDCLHHHVSALS